MEKGIHIMTNVYFVRHAQPDFSIHDDVRRPLTEKGMQDSILVTQYLRDKGIHVAITSPYKRAHDTISGFAQEAGLNIIFNESFAERKIADEWIEDFNGYAKMQWKDFTYKLPGGESLEEVQNRNIKGLNAVLKEYPQKNIVVGSHGTALSCILNYYDNRFGYPNFERIKDKMPWIVHFTFDGTVCEKVDYIDLLNN